MPNDYPVVLVHGLFGFGPNELGRRSYWGNAFNVISPLERHEASVGPISSAYDRACELAAQIKGTRIDYGASHSEQAGHQRYGGDFTGKGFVPDWSESHPVHLVGHSLGSPTIRCLQHLLEIDNWGWGSSHRWIHSINTISGVSNGSTATYFFGANEQTGCLNKETAGTALLLLIETYMYLTSPKQEVVYNFDLDQWGFDRLPGESLPDYLQRVSQSGFAVGKDNAVYSLSLQGAYADNAVWKTYPDTYYFSYVTEQTFRGFSGRYYPEAFMDPQLVPASAYIGRKEFQSPPIPWDYFIDSDWWENDGLVSTFSQFYPRISGNHPVGSEFDDNTPASDFQTGKWYYKMETSVDHLDICIFPQSSQIEWQKQFYRDLYKRLALLKSSS